MCMMHDCHDLCETQKRQDWNSLRRQAKAARGQLAGMKPTPIPQFT
jgi:hypothetical protein